MNYANLEWRDGQPYNPEFDDIYFSADSGIAETEHVFIQNNQLHQRFAQDNDFTIVETGFGSGLNFLVTAKHWLNINKTSNSLYFYSIEHEPFTTEDLKRAQIFWPELEEIADALQQQYQIASEGFHVFNLFEGRIKLVLMIGNIETMLPQLSTQADAWFLDGFAPSLNPQMWCRNVLSQIKRLSKKGTTFSTYTAVGDIRRGLIEMGFDVKKVSGCGNKRHMLIGQYINDDDSKIKSNQPWFEYSHNKINNKKITIIGAGIAGLTTAWSLVKRGFQVDVFESGNLPGTQASGNLAGMLMPRLSLQNSADAEFYNSAYFYALRCLGSLDPKQKCWKQTGGIQLASSDRIKKQMLDYAQNTALVENFNAEKASEISGIKITENVQHFPQAACVFPLKILKQLIDDMGDALTIYTNSEIESIELSELTWVMKDNKNNIINETQCLILANAWQIKKFDVISHFPLQPARGQISLIKPNKQSKKLSLPISFGGYILPEIDGQHVVGASFKLDDSETDIRQEESLQNYHDLNKHLPCLLNENDLINSRASVRTVTLDRTPVVGPVPMQSQYIKDYNDLHKGKPVKSYPIGSYYPGLYVNTGHGARGFNSAFLSAEFLASNICDEPLPVSNRVRYALHPARFLVRSFKKKGQNEN